MFHGNFRPLSERIRKTLSAIQPRDHDIRPIRPPTCEIVGTPESSNPEPPKRSSFQRNACRPVRRSAIAHFCRNAFGAPERNNLEPFGCEEILTELEEWASILQAEPEVIHRLAAFAEAAECASDEAEGNSPMGASFEEPAP